MGVTSPLDPRATSMSGWETGDPEAILRGTASDRSPSWAACFGWMSMGPGPTEFPQTTPLPRGGAGRPEVWAWGLRNPWRFAFDPVTGWLWAGDVGQSRFEEVTFVRRGGNHGWNVWEGRHCYKAETCPEASLVPALWDYPRKQGQSITGGVVYRGRAFPELTGAFLAAEVACGPSVPMARNCWV